MTATHPSPGSTHTPEQAAANRLLASFAGYEPPPDFLDFLSRVPLAGVTLFRALNARDPAQVRALTASLQEAGTRSGQPPLLICADQEGGQLIAIPGTTPFPGNMALGATRSPGLARRVGIATGRELAAMGLNVNYAPSCDVNSNSRNPVIGVRSFGEDPSLVASLASAMVEGVQSAGVAATAKHFPGHGDTAADSHFGTPVLDHDIERLERVELPPFAAAIEAGVRLVMTAHIAVPALGGSDVPSTLSPAVLRGLLRERLGFGGVVVSDAMNMGAITQGQGLAIDAIAAAAAGVDLLLLIGDVPLLESVHAGLAHAIHRGLLPPGDVATSARRVLDLRHWLAVQGQPGLDVVACEEHRELAYQVAARALTLVRDRDALLPLHLGPGARIAAVVPRTADLTPADTSSFETVSLAPAIRQYHPTVEEYPMSLDPAAEEVAALRERLAGYDAAVVCTINASDHAGQAALVAGLVASGVKVVAVALRLPYDAAAYPAAPTVIATYSLQPSSLEALAGALFGRAPFEGRLPVTVPGT
jgi:beta-N-acetylhexosaminidase